MTNRIFSLIGWLGTAFVVAALAIRFELPAIARLTVDARYAYYLAWAGLACMLVYTLSQWREIGRMFSRRQARYGTLAASSVIIVLAVLTAINYIATRQSKRWDLTEAQQYTLSDQSRNVVSKLDSPMQIMVFDRETEFQRYRDRLREYQAGSEQITTEYIDPDKKPAIAQQNAIQSYGTILFNYRGRTERVIGDTEQDVTNGIIKVVSGQQRKVYFTQGHGEKNPGNTARDGYSTARDSLLRENYLVEQVAIAQTGRVPDDAAVVIVAGPTTDFFPPEIDALKQYLDKGGKLLLALDPPAKPGAPQPTSLIALAREWGIEVGNDVVLDVSGMGRLFGASEEVPVAVTYPSHAITERFEVMTVYPMARSVGAVSGGVEGRTAETIVETSRGSWAETDVPGVLSEQAVKMDTAAGDKQGPIPIAAAVSAPVAASPEPAVPAALAASPEAPAKSETRVVAFGDSDFASNSAAGVQGNVDLFMNTLGWLSQQENLISVRPKQATDRRITLTAAQQTQLGWLALAVIPGMIFGTGIMRWWRRR
jgi:ABC-type uncharacterized transport system involved in gliding motility auxiliary subunit